MKAVFFDRDGTLNEMVFNPDTGEYEPPKNEYDLVILSGVFDSLKEIQKAGFKLFLVSNQPDYAKGKNSLKNINDVQEKFKQILYANGIKFQDYYYCYHHPNGIIPDYSYKCECRKPNPYFLIKSSREYGINLKESWIIGDRDTDIECGKKAGVKTILIEYKYSRKNRGLSIPDFRVANIKEAAKVIIQNQINIFDDHYDSESTN